VPPTLLVLAHGGRDLVGAGACTRVTGAAA
jgi:hypothetical protein